MLGRLLSTAYAIAYLSTSAVGGEPVKEARPLAQNTAPTSPMHYHSINTLPEVIVRTRQADELKARQRTDKSWTEIVLRNSGYNNQRGVAFVRASF